MRWPEPDDEFKKQMVVDNKMTFVEAVVIPGQGLIAGRGSVSPIMFDSFDVDVVSYR